MAHRTAARFAVTKQGNPRCVLSVSERPNGDLILNLRGKQLSHFEPIPFKTEDPNQFRGTPVRELRYSIHTSPNSVFGTNTLKLTRVLENGEEPASLVLYTTAIKDGSGFVPLYGRYCSAMNDKGYDIDKMNARFEFLGEISVNFTLVFAVFIGPPNRKFNIGPESFDTFQMRQLIFREFSLVFMWSFLSVTEQNSSWFLHLGTPAGGTPMPGFDEGTCLLVFQDVRERLRQHLVGTLLKVSELAEFHRFISASTFFREARTGTPEFKVWFRSLTETGVL